MKVSNRSHDDFGGTRWPPGFRFHPTDEELILYYLKKKMRRRRLALNVIRELDVYKWEPEELEGQSLLKTGDRQWYFFSPRDRRYPNGGRMNRATRHGHWKSTGKDRDIIWNGRKVGVKKTLVFYQGRAPSGDRTDWVMHEYTMDEEELKRCHDVKDSFALYKVFKKSGPGPKNGEHYGAPFREEEWADDDEPVDAVQLLNAVPSVDSFTIHSEGRLVENGREEILGRFVDDPKVDVPQIDEFAHFVHQLDCEEETLSTMVDPSVGEAISTEPGIVVLHPGGQQSVAHASFEVTKSTTSNMYSCEAPEVSSAPTISEQDQLVGMDDFLEMDDLWDPVPSFPEMGNACDNSQLQETNGHSQLQETNGHTQLQETNGHSQLQETNVHAQLQETNGSDGPHPYFDADVLLQELGPFDQRMMSQSFFDTFEGGMASELNYQLLSQSNDTNNINSGLWTYDQRSSLFASPGSDQLAVYQGMTSQSSFDTLQGDIASELNHQFSQSDYTNNVSSELWSHEETSSINLLTGVSQGLHDSPTPGLLHAGSSPNLTVEARQNEGGSQGERQDSWISSKFWSILETIPTTPAAASESPLINRAFERMSSFRRTPVNANNVDVNAAGGTPNVRSGGGRRGIGFLSFIGVMRAVIWVLMLSTTVKVLSTFLGRFLSS